ncbi:Mitochondrial ribonuclease P protein 1 like protein [Habropoda laboriosa]|uniref:RNA (guanine-9-)-methyltransferase domain-containing protein 1 n=1 Tax=Habropoda laboriosa TaxID=597456 RepID=A0A0L7RA55_9HYME|nr:PREDICTED: mitochondrial ribonuclease P protein 1 homolog [Habropoda laboriosa]KOC67636.1 Mitochondrial ribonuclease P protein 1 like protein [Habropoda laboriosa]
MYTRVSLRFMNIATKLYSNVFIHLTQHKLIPSQFNYFVNTRALLTRGYCTDVNPSAVIRDEHAKLDEKELNELLQNPQYEVLYQKYKLEIEFLRQATNKIPSTLSSNDWLQLLKAQTRGQRRSYLEYAWRLEMKEITKAKKKEMNEKERSSLIQKKDDDSPYGLNKCTMFFRIRDSAINMFYNRRLISAIMYEPTIVLDLGYESCMAPSEQQNCAKQLLLSFSVNRTHDEPFNLHFCNVNMDGIIIRRLHKVLPQLHEPDFPLNLNTESYLDIFDKNKLVYLSPHAQAVMTKYDPNLVYIIGAMVDKINPKPFSFEKAKREGIKMMKLPLSEKLEWGMGSTKNLPLNQVLSILLDLRHTNDWTKALEHIPKRKLREAREDQLVRKLNYRERRIEYMSSLKTD